MRQWRFRPRRSPSSCSAVICRPTCCLSVLPVSTAVCRCEPTRSSAHRAERSCCRGEHRRVPLGTGGCRAAGAAAASCRRGLRVGSRTRGGEGAGAAASRSATLADLLEHYESELTAYQDRRLRRHLRRRRAETSAAILQERLGDGRLRFAEAYADGLFKLMAYKDEYEVARLHLDLIERARLHAEFGEGARVKVLLHPPVLRATGDEPQAQLGRSASATVPGAAWLAKAARDHVDPSATPRCAGTERALIEVPRDWCTQAVAGLAPATAAVVLAGDPAARSGARL